MVKVGVMIDKNSIVGTYIDMGLSDFYDEHASYRTRLSLCYRDSHKDVVAAASAVVQTFGWKEVVPVYEDTDYGNGLIPYITDAFQEIDTRVPYRSVIHPSAHDIDILNELVKLMTMQTRANKAGMLNDETVWIATDGLTSLLDPVGYRAKESMQGVIGVRPHLPMSKRLERFKKKYLIRTRKLNLFALWGYDTVSALANAVEMAWWNSSMSQNRRRTRPNAGTGLNLSALGVSEMGPEILRWIRNSTVNGLTGRFQLVNGQLCPSKFEVFNVVGHNEWVIGYWTPKHGLCSKVLKELPFALPYEFKPFMNASRQSAGSYDDLLYQITLGVVDAVVADMTIIANRSNYVDFALPYSESGVSMLVAMKDDERRNTWIFLKPLKWNLWLTTGLAFVFTGFVMGILERQKNEDFNGSPSEQFSLSLWFSFSTLVFAHRG
ncbi:hypothetical protein CDL15_Pgr017674 [Punica granatum]|uniref:Ionotropic glutamate receptor C-terminal domain-containing protein n=1 Tax=Punica granatum TaxID=22663 RepID=A0A218WXN0_PUNGR|nr:hypothetical protein CDL15_Pgr017674 [Punica granatum]